MINKIVAIVGYDFYYWSIVLDGWFCGVFFFVSFSKIVASFELSLMKILLDSSYLFTIKQLKEF